MGTTVGTTMTAWRDYPILAKQIRPGMHLRVEPLLPPERVTRTVDFGDHLIVNFGAGTSVRYPSTLTVRVHVPLDPPTKPTACEQHDDDLEPAAIHRHLVAVRETL